MDEWMDGLMQWTYNSIVLDNTLDICVISLLH